MADNLIFPIKFDLEKAVEQAGKDWDGKFADKLEKLMAKRSVNVKLNLDIKNLDSLDAVRQRLAELKLEPITPETRNAIRSLTQELKTLEKILERIQRLNAGRESTRAYINEQRLLAYKEKTHQAEERAKKAAELTEQAKKRTEILQQKLEQQITKTAAAEQRLANIQKNNVSNISRANGAYASQSTNLQRLTQRMAAYWSIRQVGNFLTNVREVTAQFELQRVSLGAIIQDQQRANALFSEIKSFALKSPVSIMDLTKYTKQLAAYKIGVDELFETTKKLTDVSVGLGVSMDRVVLAYGQVRARGALYASEIRQFTEMGVPIVEELAAKLTKMNGELVTAKDVLKQVEKGAISFELVKEVFDDMTSAGGMFYNMQEKQGNTLFGMWAKLGDAASVMYDEIGNTESVNKGMKDLIQLLTDLMKNWRTVANELKTIGIGFAVFKAATVIIKAMQVNTIAAAAATRSMTLASIQHRRAVAAGNPVMGAYTTMLRRVAVWNRQAALSTNLFTVAANKLKVALVSWGPMAIVAGLGMLISYLVSAAEKAGRLKKELNGIAGETGVEISRMVTNFESLAKKAVEAADGSREQKDALSELQRTYRSIIPEQNLTIDKLREMKGEYSNLTIAIREYIREQQLQKGLSAISENYGKKLIDAQKEFRDKLEETKIESKGGAGFYLSEQQIDRIVELFNTLVREGKSAQEALQTAFQYEGIDHLVESYDKLANDLGLIKKYQQTVLRGKDFSDFRKETFWVDEGVRGLTKAIQDEEKAIADFKKQMDGTIPTLGRLADYIDKAKQKISEHNFVSKENTFAYNQETAKVQINAYIEALEEAIKSTNVGIDLSKFITIDPKGVKNLDFSGLKKALSELNSKWRVPLQGLTEEVQNVYDGFIPSEATTRSVREKFTELAESMGILDKVKSKMIGASESLEDYRKKINDTYKDYAKQVENLTKVLAITPIVSKDYLDIEGKLKDAKELEEFYKLFAEMLGLDNTGGTHASQSDPRLGILNEMASTLKQINKEYDDLLKKEGETRALADTQKIYADTFKNMQALAEQYKFDLPDFGVPTDTASLTKYLGAIKDAVAKLPKSQKAALSLQVDIDKLNIDDKQKQIEEELKRLAEQVSRTKAAQEFYDKILGTTGDIELATNMTMSIYGETGENMNAQMAEYISSLFGQVDVEMPMNIIAADGTIDYTAMEKFVRDNEKILGDSYKELIKIAQDGQKNMAKTYEGYMKDLEVAKTYADKRIELARDTANKINEIERERVAAQKKLDKLVASGKTDKDTQSEIKRLEAKIKAYSELPKQYEEREAREAAKLEYEAFKDTPLYTQMFEDLDYASTSALTRMRDRLVALKDQWKNLDPTQLKELQNRLEEIDSQLAARNPFKTLIDAYKQWRDLRKSGRTKEGDELAADAAETARQEAEKKMIADEKAYQAAVKKYGAESDAAKAAREAADASKEEYDNAENTANETARQANDWNQISELIGKAAKSLKEYQQAFNDIAGGVRDMMEAFGASSEDMQFFDDMVGGFNKIMDAGEKAASAATNIMSGNPLMIAKGIGQGFSAIGGLVSGFTDLFSAGRVKRANKEIKHQQELLDNLSRAYDELEDVTKKTFGTQFLKNYNLQIQTLQAQQRAYLKQAEAERSKGKKEDEEKTKEFENKAYETAQKIKELQDNLVVEIVGTDVASAARDFANAWLDAYLSFESTSDAIRNKFNDMMKNMIVNMALGGIVQRVLEPFFEEIEDAVKNNNLSTDELANVMKKLPGYVKQVDEGLSVGIDALKQAGFDISQLGEKTSTFKGISRDIASASEESINGLAVGINTQNFYISQIHANVAIIAQMMLSDNSTVTPTGGISVQELVTLQNTYLSSMPAIEANTAATVARCERVAIACENMANQINRVIRPVGTKAAYSVSTTLS